MRVLLHVPNVGIMPRADSAKWKVRQNEMELPLDLLKLLAVRGLPELR